MSYASGRFLPKRLYLPGLVICVILIGAHLPTWAQSGGGVDQTGTGGRHVIQGRVYFPSGRRSDVRVKVRLENFNAGDLTVLSDANGSFVFKSLKSGSYTVVVDAGEEYLVAREPVYIDTDGVNPRRGVMMTPVSRLFNVQISLQLKPAVSAKAAVIDAKLAAAPEKAQAAYRRAVGFIQVGETPKAIEQLIEAIRLFPDFPLALNELGVQYLKQGQPDKAADVLKTAVRLSPKEFPPLLNYGIALLNLRKFLEAEQQLRECLKIDTNVPTAHMYLGIVLAVQRKLDEGQSELELAIKSNLVEVALAHRYLAGVFLERHDYKRAADSLETYLKMVPKAADYDLLSKKVKELRKKNIQ